MSSTNRIHIPENYQDWASSQLLVQPEPQRPYAQMWLGAINAALPDTVPAGLPGREQSTTGEQYSSLESNVLTVERRMLFETLFGVKINFAGKPGDNVRVNRPSFSDYNVTEADRRLARGASVTTNAINLQSEQVNVTLYEFGGPYDGDNTRIAPFALEAFDGQFGIHDQPSIIAMHLKRDLHRFLEAQIVAMGDTGTAIYSDRANFTAVNDATSADQFPMTFETLSRTCRVMDEADVPRFPNGKRLFVLTPAGKQALVNDPQYAYYAQKFEAKNPLTTTGMFGESDDWMLYCSNTLNTTDNTNTIAIHRGHAWAPGAMGLGMGRPPRVALSTDDDYGRSLKMIWLADLGFKLIDSRFVYSVRYTAESGS